MKKYLRLLLFLVGVIFFNSCVTLPEFTNPVDPQNKIAVSSPNLISPNNGATDQSLSPILNWSASSGATSYTLQVSTSSLFLTFIYNQSGLTGTSQQINGLSSNTKYYWRANAMNPSGPSDWSSLWSFTTIYTTPAALTLSSPVNGATNQPTSPTLIWNSSSGATSFTLQVSEDNQFTSFIYNQSGLTGTSRQVNGLSNSTTYYWRVSATNTVGTSGWSSVWSFMTVAPPFICGTSTVIYSGKTYNTVQIGYQCWFRENLDVGVLVETTTGAIHSDVTNNGVIEKYCYANNESYCATYGGLYDWNEAMGYNSTPGTQGICPTGWHLPTLAEFEALKATVNNNSNTLKTIGQGIGAGAGTNTSGFSALLASSRGNSGFFSNLGDFAWFWSSTEHTNKQPYFIYMEYYSSDINLILAYKESGFSVRCVKD